MLDIKALRHSKEKTYFTIAAAVGGLFWLSLLLGTLGTILLVAPMVLIPMWMTQQFFKAAVFGNAVKVGPRQYPQLHAMVEQTAKQMGLDKVPDVFILNGEGGINAFAVKFLTGQYVMLYSGLVDLLLERKMTRELKMIVAHELAHHAASHTSPGKNFLIMPAKFVPYVGMAYSRACEFTADRIGAAATGDLDASKRALLAIATGLKSMRTDVDAFVAQEAEIPGLFGYINEVYSSHPRMTRRLIELETMRGMLPKRPPTQQLPEPQHEAVAVVARQPVEEEA